MKTTRPASLHTSALLEGPDGWQLHPDGAAVHPDERVAVIADVHLGYEWARAYGGDCVPPHSLAETVAKLTRVLDPSNPRVERLVVAGDLVESHRPCFRTRRDVNALRDWLAGLGVELVVLLGNHDRASQKGLRATLDVGGWTVAHGHRPINAVRTVSGHIHPALRFSGVTAPCFIVGPTVLVLPAFSPNAAGVSLATLGLSHAPDGSALRCVASAGGELLDFGQIEALLKCLNPSGRTA